MCYVDSRLCNPSRGCVARSERSLATDMEALTGLGVFMDNTPMDVHQSGSTEKQNIIKQKSHPPELISRPLVITMTVDG